MSGSISFSGLATGINSASIISQLMSVASAPLTNMKSQKSTVDTEANIFNQLKTALSTFQSQVASIKTVSSFGASQAASSNTAVATVSSTAEAQAGTHTLVVTGLASSQVLASQGYASETALNFKTGTLVISRADGSNPVNIKIKEGQNSLDGIVDAINSATNPTSPVTASVLNTGDANNPYMLILRGKDAGSYKIDASALTTTPLSGAGTAYAAPGMTQKIPPAPATFTLDGVDLTAQTNTVSGQLKGVTINLLAAAADGSKSTEISVSNNTSAVSSTISTFINSYNNIIDGLSSQSDYDANSKSGGLLSGNQTLRGLQYNMQSLVTTALSGVAAGAPQMLADIGITTDAHTGKLSIDQSKLTAALTSNYTGVVNLFTQNSATAGLSSDKYGLAERFRQLLDNYTRVSVDPKKDGVLDIAIKSLNRQSTDITDRMADLQKLLDVQEEAYKQQFAQMERLIASIKGTGSSLLSALGVNNNTSNSSTSYNFSSGLSGGGS